MKYLKSFQKQTDYQSFIESDSFVTPNVSFATEENLVFYNPQSKIEADIIATFNATSSNLYALRKTSGVEKLYVNDEEITNFGTSYSFAEPGEYTVSIILDENKFVPESGFSGTTLTSVEVGSDVTSIGFRAFQNCSRLTSVIIGPGVTSIEPQVFSNCSSLTGVTIGSGVTSIGAYAFSGCSSLTGITIPDSVTSIGTSAFQYCAGLTSIVVSSSNTVYDSRENCNCIIETASNKLIQGCKNSFIPDSVTSIGSNAFESCSGLTSVTIGSGVTTIGSYAFRSCSGLTSINIPNSVTSIEFGAFQNCSKLTSVTIPDSVTSIRNWAFQNCSGLTSVTIGLGVISIGDYVFAGCTSLPVEGNLRYADTFLVEAVDKTQTSYIIKEGTKWIGCEVFSGYTSLTSIIIPDSVTSIGNSAFSNCSKLTSINIPDSVTSIGDNVFYGCYRLPVEGNLRYADTYLVGAVDNTQSTYNIKEGTKWIGYGAFSFNENLTGITIPDSVTSIEIHAFNSCSGLTSITIPDLVTSIGQYAFRNCTSLTSITCYATTAPTIINNTFEGIKSNGILYYPAGFDYSSWLSTNSCYLGYYDWTGQEITH